MNFSHRIYKKIEEGDVTLLHYTFIRPSLWQLVYLGEKSMLVCIFLRNTIEKTLAKRVSLVPRCSSSVWENCCGHNNEHFDGVALIVIEFVAFVEEVG